MLSWVRSGALSVYERLIESELSGAPSHVAVIQDGNRRYADKEGADKEAGYEAGAQTTEQVLEWCDELGVEELTLYTVSTENFERPKADREHLFDLITEKLYEFADAERVHEGEVSIRAIGELERLPERVREAVDYAESQTADYDRLSLNIALAYGGREELLGAARSVCERVAAGDIDPDNIDVDTLDAELGESPTRDVDLIVRTGGDERTSNFLPWHANGNEAAAYFCTPYWPEFRTVDFLRAIRTYESREASWRKTRARRALALVQALSGMELPEARRVLGRFRDALPSGEREAAEDLDSEPSAD